MSTAPKDFVGSHKQKDWPKHLIICAFIIIELFPLYMMFQVSFKDNASFLRNPWAPTPPFSVVETRQAADGTETVKTRVADWSEAFSSAKPSDPSVKTAEKSFDLSVYKVKNWNFGLKLIGPYIANTVFVAVTGTFFTLTLAIFGAYFFARYKMPFSNVLWSAFLVLMLMPGVANIVPLFSLLKELSLLNTLWALVIVGVAGGQVFNIFVLRNFIEDLPKDLFEAAEMDGASHIDQIRNVVIPMSGSIIGTLSILCFLGQWNDFLLSLIILRDKELFTLGVGLIYLDGEYVKQWGQMMAAYFIASIPLIVIFLFCMRLFVRGLSAGAVKG
ncbi:carbohydrate ABC transporter permease [Rariglobus hedericola]|uniref:Carbohydrate ABC transporter permease n=1 Tax=Rariglobus hedericola TaxID=2597822 RepID=A0A556QPY6_9BACT|nr:carbohydrate ABC transporter permease [Rariglobus hedericola]TSJ78713.1 carbohydrate ABC transporter permease [Rariglobus hedericola]